MQSPYLTIAAMRSTVTDQYVLCERTSANWGMISHGRKKGCAVLCTLLLLIRSNVCPYLLPASACC